MQGPSSWHWTKLRHGQATGQEEKGGGGGGEREEEEREGETEEGEGGWFVAGAKTEIVLTSENRALAGRQAGRQAGGRNNTAIKYACICLRQPQSRTRAPSSHTQEKKRSLITPYQTSHSLHT